MSFLVHNNYFQYGLIGIGTIVLGEVVYYIYSHLKRKLDDSENVYDVYWTNNLSQNCNCNVRKQENSCNNNYCYVRTVNRIISLIDNSKVSIDLAMYILTSHDLTNAILRARKRGVRVRIIVDKNMVHSTSSKIIELDANGKETRFFSRHRKILHHKQCVYLMMVDL